jgi:hypothetical protein
MTSAKLSGGEPRKYSPNMLPMDCAEKVTFGLPCFFPQTFDERSRRRFDFRLEVFFYQRASTSQARSYGHGIA